MKAAAIDVRLGARNQNTDSMDHFLSERKINFRQNYPNHVVMLPNQGSSGKSESAPIVFFFDYPSFSAPACATRMMSDTDSIRE